MKRSTFRILFEWSVLSVFFLTPFSDFRWVMYGIPLYAPEWGVLVALVVFFCGRFIGVFPWKPFPGTFFVAAALIVSGSVLSLGMPGFDREGLGGIKSWVVFPILFAILMAQLSDDARFRIRLLFTWFLPIAAVALLSLVPGLFEETYDGRLKSYFPSPNHLALFLEYGVIIGLFVSQLVVGSRVVFPIVSFLAASTIVAVVRTESSGAIVSVLAGVALFFFLSFVPARHMKKILSFVAFAVVVAVASAALSVDWTALSSGEIRSPLASRVMIWNASAVLIAEHPVFGIGMRNFQEAYLSLQPMFPPYLEWAVPHPHNVVLAFWLNSGLFGLLGFFVALAGAFRVLTDAMKKQDTRPVSIAAFSLLAVISVHGLVDTPYFKTDLAFFFWAIIGLTAGLRADGIEKEKGAEAPKKR